jgi:hypothetical protein
MPQTPVSHSARLDDMHSDTVLDISRHSPVGAPREDVYEPDLTGTAAEDVQALQRPTIAHNPEITPKEDPRRSISADASAPTLRQVDNSNTKGFPFLGITIGPPAQGLPSPPLTRRTSNDSRTSTRLGSPHATVPVVDEEGLVFATSADDMLESPAEDGVAMFALPDETGDPGPSTAAARRELAHPLQDVGTPSPPPWEVIHPPPENGNGLSLNGHHAKTGTYSTHHTLGRASGMGLDGGDDRTS